MDIKDRIAFRALQAGFFAGMVEYPNDTDRMEQGYKIFEEWIDKLITRELSAAIGSTATLQYQGRVKGGGGSGGPSNIVH
jgi:hypothetical protein